MKADEEERCYTWLEMQNCEEYTRFHMIFCGVPGHSPICEFEVDFCIFVLKDESGNVVKRGIRIWEYEYSVECDCFDNIEELILEYILSRPDFIEIFEFTYGPNGEEQCYYHFEVITEPCYIEVFNDGVYSLQYCEQEPIACCQNYYLVCYEENPWGNPSLTRFEFENMQAPLGNCSSPCESNCERWGAIIITPGKMSIGQIENQLQYLPVQNTLTINANEILNVNVNIEENNSLKYQLVDYLGNIHKSDNLISYDGTIEVNTKGLLKGVYFLYIEVNSSNFVYKVIII